MWEYLPHIQFHEKYEYCIENATHVTSNGALFDTLIFSSNWLSC
jgi:hypothetical protein